MPGLHAAFPESFGPGTEPAVLRMLGAHRACAAEGLVRQQEQSRMHLGQEAAGAAACWAGLTGLRRAPVRV